MSSNYRGQSSLGVMYGRMQPLVVQVEASDTLILDQDLLKVHCAVDGEDLDDLLSLYEAAAIAWAEDMTNRTLLAREHVFVVSDFPRCAWPQEVVLPRGLCQSITSVQYTSGGELQTLADTGYQKDLKSENGARLLPPINQDWPSVDLGAINPVVFTYEAGWPTPITVPKKIHHALMFAVADMLEVRGVTDLQALMGIAASGKTFDARMSLISKYVINKVY